MSGRAARGFGPIGRDADDRGGTMTVFALILVALLVTTTLVLDFGAASQQKQRAQGAVDNAALAGAVDFPAAATAEATAVNYVARNLGLTSFGTGSACGTDTRCYESNGWSLSVTTPYASSPTKIRVQLCRPIVSVFGQIVGADIWTVCTSAAARSTAPVLPGPSILVLAPSGDQTFTCSGACSITSQSVVVNSTGTKGLRVSGGGRITSNTIQVGSAAAVGVDNPGNVTCGGANFNTSGCPTLSTPTPNPYASVTGPSQASVTTSYPSPGCSTILGVLTCRPGVYGSTLTVSSTQVVFLPGIYYLKDGLTISGGSPASGANVFFYNEAGKFTISGGSSLDFTPLGDGSPYGQMFVMQAPTNTEKMTISGGSTTNVPGTIYNPAGETIYSGGSGTGPGVGQVVTYKLTVSGDSYIGTPPSGGPSSTGLVELFE